MASATPDISVVIPTHRRETRLAFALEALAAQTLAPERFEVVVVRDSDGGPLPPAPPGLRVRFLTLAGEGNAPAQRNLGWRSATAPLVAFTDDDCRPGPRWLEQLLAARNGTSVFLQGRTEPDPDEVHLLHGQARSQEIVAPTEWFETCNMAYPRELLERLDGFDESFRWVCEDTDLGLRARELGARCAYVDGALVWHGVMPRTMRVALREAVRKDALSILSRHEMIDRRGLHRGYFMRRSHARLGFALLGLLVFRRRPVLAAAATLPYVADSPRKWRVPPRAVPRMLAQTAFNLPPRLIVDLVEMVVTARSAIRYRFPAL